MNLDICSFSLQFLRNIQLYLYAYDTLYIIICRIEDKRDGKCFGGVARLQTAIKNLKTSNKNVLWVSAGDFYQGTVWYSHFKWRVVARFNNLLNFDAITLGNHEFDDGVRQGVL